MSEALERFEAEWLPRLNRGASTVFQFAEAPGESRLHTAIADAFVSGLGYSAIGFNWELLDAEADAASPRSARGELTQAIANDIANPNSKWLGGYVASRCASDLLNAFDASTLTVVSNRFDGLWNPIAGADVEWAFVLFDDTQIALLLITPER